ncbi:MAG: orotate phosphoribosyltransferase [Acidimicrobiia bacterium]|nr:orotate phosphoribosyltransferase [Acidimicrobiia bacterium]
MSTFSENFLDAKQALVDHLVAHSVRTDGPFRLASGATSSWYIDARQTTFSGSGALVVGEAVLEHVPSDIDGVGGMTMGADPIAVATAMVAASTGRDLVAFSIRKQPKAHGTGGRLVGPVSPGHRVVVLEDTTTTGAALVEAIDVLVSEGVEVAAAIAVVDRSDGATPARMADRGIPYHPLVTPVDLGVQD